MSQVLTTVQYSGLGLLFFGDSVFETIGMRPPALYEQAKQNKAWSAFLVFMIGNQINAGLVTTGAFEVTHGFLAKRCIRDNTIVCRDMVQTETVFSKIEQGRFPAPEEVLDFVRVRDGVAPAIDDLDGGAGLNADAAVEPIAGEDHAKQEL